VISALLALLLAQVTGLRGDMRELTKKVNEHDRKFEGIEKVFKLNGCEQPEPGCRR
jgi:hypothetical protein